ncbi:MAG: hypothetical protein KME26_26300 [Oscillatoria princeps RMCB-10]|nr:hypothetical protein [Oscillatoria princeps RMCB-10]
MLEAQPVRAILRAGGTAGDRGAGGGLELGAAAGGHGESDFTHQAQPAERR